MGNNLITFRFKDEIYNINYANKEFKKFIKRARYKLGYFKYVAVLQFNKKGVIKFIMMTELGIRFKKDLVKIWNNGSVWIEDLRYMSSLNYFIGEMSKNINDERLIGKKTYFTSRNLIRK